MTIDGYKLSEKIYLGTRTEVYRGTYTRDGKPVIIKVLRNRNPTFKELVQFRNQYVITRNLDHRAIVQPLALERYGNGYALVMPDDGAIGLTDYWQQSSVSLTEFLNIAMQLAEALHYLGRERIVHKDIKPTNIVIHPETRKVQLIDFSISSLLPKEQQQLLNPNVLEGTLAYISPEQTGRMNRGIDYRTDFYSLGVTFFELLTGQLPFITDDPMELVHCHIAQAVQFPSASGVDEVMGAMVLKLMAKNAEDRYQSALGLKHDLERCLQQLSATGKITPFALGQRDRCERFIIPEKLYGRETQVQTLLDAFERVSVGATLMMLVAGFSGIGKTAVVNEVHKPIVKKKGYFIKGKFDQLNRNIPFSAFVQAFRDLMGQLLGSEDAELANWKAKIMAAVGENGQVLIDVIPELENIIGQQPAVPELAGSAAQNRFNLLFGKFVGVFTTKEHPLVIFLDDLQWADLASLNLLKLLMGESEAGYLLVLGAYRDNEVFPGHPLMLSLDEIQHQGANIDTLTLAPLHELDITHLVADTLLCENSIAALLSQLVYQKTRGNPFFTTQFLQGLHADGLITFEGNKGYWQCDLTGVRQLALTDDVVEFMVGRLALLPSDTQDVLKLAACIGNRFDLGTLAVVYSESQDEVATYLWQALLEGFVVPENETYKFFQGDSQEPKSVDDVAVGYRFLHDRVQQAAYSLIDSDRRKQTHLEIGRRLWAKMDGRSLNIFEVVDHLNLGVELVGDRSQGDEIARLNLLAAQKAKGTTAYAAAREYANGGRSLLAENSWSTQYDLTLALYVETVEIEYLNTNYDAVESLAQIVLERAQTILDRVKVYEVSLLADIGQGKMQQVLDRGLQVLDMLGISLSEDPRDAIDNLQELIDLPEMTDPHKLAAMNIIANMMSPAWGVNPQLYKQLIFTMVALSLEYGNCGSSAFGYCGYSVFFCEGLGDLEFGYEFGELAVGLVDRFNALEIKSKVLIVFASSIMLWKQPLRECIKVQLEAMQSGLEAGDLEYGCYGAAEYCHYLFIMGQPLDFTRERFEQYQQTLERFKQDYHLDFMASWQQAIRNLQGKSNHCTLVLSQNLPEEVECLQKLVEEKQVVLVFNAYLLKTFLSYLFKERKAAVENAKLMKQYAPDSGTNMFVPPAMFYGSLALIAGLAHASLQEREEYLQQISDNLVQMEHWAKYAPMNYQHQCDLIKAEKARSLGEKWEAVELYKRARSGARENEYLHHEALSCELTAEFYLEEGMPEIAQVYLTDAYYAYARWGAKAKVEDLTERYHQLLAPILNQKQSSLTGNVTSPPMTAITVNSTNAGSGDLLDLSSAIKTSQALSGEMELERLLAKLMQAVMENAGATKSALLLPKGETLFIEAMVDYTEETQNIRISSLASSLPLSSNQELPISIINTVWRTRETLVINDVINQSRFASDPYLIDSLPKSVLCLPLVDRGKPTAVLYLENHLTEGVFTCDRLELLKLIAAQGAISLENARLYHRLEDYSHNLEVKVEQRTEELQSKNQDLQQTLQDLQLTQAQLIQAERMSGLGQMVAGIAHEINNPITFIAGNIEHARDYVRDLLDLLAVYEQNYPEPLEAILDKVEEIDLSYLCDDLENLFDSMQNGSSRIRQIVLGLRNFSRLDESQRKPVDIHEGLENTLMIVQHRSLGNGDRPSIAIVKNYGTLPPVYCNASQLNQVFLHIITNAIDALMDYGDFPEIRITTEMLDSKNVRIAIADNGPGIPESDLGRIFDPFFTTKPVGEGTGLGLSISYQIITEQHGGQLHCISHPGLGTEFAIDLPLCDSHS